MQVAFTLTFFVLVEITGQPNVVMQYVNYERDIVLRFGIELIGWTHPTWINPSELSTSLPPLQALLDAIKSGTCKFVRLTHGDRKVREAEYYKKVEAGEIDIGRKKRKDAGKKRGPRKKQRQVDSEEDSDSANNTDVE